MQPFVRNLLCALPLLLASAWLWLVPHPLAMSTVWASVIVAVCASAAIYRATMRGRGRT